MGTCRFCGEDAGWLRGEHWKCRNVRETALERMRAACVTAAATGRGIEDLEYTLQYLAQEAWVDRDEIRPIMIKGWVDALNDARADIVLGRKDHQSLNEYRTYTGLKESELADFGIAEKLRQLALLRSLIVDGAIPNHDAMEDLVKAQPRAMFSLMNSETLLWVFPDVEYMTEVSQRRYSAGSRGVSVRVAKGVNVRVGQTKGHSYTDTSMKVVDSGILGISTKHMYWAGQRGLGRSKSFRIRLDRIVSTERYSNAVGIMRDGQRAKPESFSGLDGQFASVLILAATAALDEGGFANSERTLDEMVDDPGLLFTAASDAGTDEWY